MSLFAVAHNEMSLGYAVSSGSLPVFDAFSFVRSQCPESSGGVTEEWLVLLGSSRGHPGLKSSSCWASWTETLALAVRTHSCPFLSSLVLLCSTGSFIFRFPLGHGVIQDEGDWVRASVLPSR